MKNLLIVLLVLAVAAVAFFLGQRTAPAQSQAAPVPAAASEAGPDSPSTNSHGEKLSSEPTRTFRGPTGLPMLISYEVDAVPDNNNRELVKAGVLSDMKHHPRNIERSYGLGLDEIKDIVEGRKPFPELLLPKPAAEPPATR